MSAGFLSYPKNILEYIIKLGNINPRDVSFLRASCHYIYAKVTDRAKNIREHNHIEFILLEACGGNYKDLAIWSKKNGANMFAKGMKAACIAGHLDMVKWCLKHGTYYVHDDYDHNISDAIEYAHRSHNDHIVKWFSAQSGVYIPDRVMEPHRYPLYHVEQDLFEITGDSEWRDSLVAIWWYIRCGNLSFDDIFLFTSRFDSPDLMFFKWCVENGGRLDHFRNAAIQLGPEYLEWYDQESKKRHKGCIVLYAENLPNGEIVSLLPDMCPICKISCESTPFIYSNYQGVITCRCCDVVIKEIKND